MTRFFAQKTLTITFSIIFNLVTLLKSYSKKQIVKNAAKKKIVTTLTEASLQTPVLTKHKSLKASCAPKKRHDPFWAKFKVGKKAKNFLKIVKKTNLA